MSLSANAKDCIRLIREALAKKSCFVRPEHDSLAGMLFRIVTVAIVGFWLASVGWLCAVIWAPPESRMAQVDPREVYEVFFAWNESTRMTLLENGSRRGEITIAGGSGDDRKTGLFVNSFSMTGTIDTIDPSNDFPGIDLSWRGLAEFSRELEFDSGDFSVRIPGLNMSAHVSLEGRPMVTKAAVSMSEIPVFRFDSSKDSFNSGSLQSLPLAGAFGGGLPFSSMAGKGELDESVLDSLKVDARMGNFTFGGRDLQAYLLIFSSGDHDEAMRVFLSGVGEPLRIETDFGFEAVSEILMPLEAYLKKKESPSDD